MSRPLNQIIRETTKDYLGRIDRKNPPNPEDVETELLQDINDAIETENAVISKGRKLKYQHDLDYAIIADIFSDLYHVYRIPCAGNEADEQYDVLAMYQTSGPNKGIYITSEEAFRKIAQQYNRLFSQHDFLELMSRLRATSERKLMCTDPDLIAVNNGIFNFKTKTLMPFDSDRVFLSKSHVDYVPNAVNPVIHNTDDGTDWDVESWMRELTDDPEITQLLWEIIGAIIRPNVRWNKSAWLYSQKGENGKGTLCELMRNICGPGSYTSLELENFGKDFRMEPLIHATAIITDENNTGEFISKAAGIKAIITNDVLQIDRKFKTPISFRFRGFMVQCINELPRMKDKTDSMYRRQLFVPFSKSFTGVAREYIKDDYVGRPEVLQYVLWRVLNMDYYKLSEPQACRTLLSEYKEYNDPIRQFADEIMPQLVWDLAPFSFLYDLYKAWYKDNSPSGILQSKSGFVTDLLNILPSLPNWECRGKSARIRHGNMMDKPEPLIIFYGLDRWKNASYTGSDKDKICQPTLQESYRGLIRVSTGAGVDDIDAA